MDDKTHRKAEIFIDLSHPFRVAAGKIIVDGDDVNPLARKGVEVGGKGGHKGLAFTGFHFADTSLMKHDTAGYLNREMLHFKHSPGRLAADGKGVGQNVVKGLALCKAVFEHLRLAFKLLVGHGRIFSVKLKHLFGYRLDLFKLSLAVISEK